MKDPFEHMKEAKERWGKTPEYRDYESRKVSPELQQIAANELMAIFGEFGGSRSLAPDSQPVQSLVKKLQKYISGHFYTCSDETLAQLGEMYVADERFQNNIDSYAGEGTAAFVSEAIRIYCGSAAG